MIRKLLEIRPAEPACIKMMAAGIPLNRSQNKIQLGPKLSKKPFRYFPVMDGDIADVGGELWVADDLHRLGASTRLPEFLLGQPLNPAGLQILKALHDLFIANAVGIWIEIFYERRNQLRTVGAIQLRSLFQQLCDV